MTRHLSVNATFALLAILSIGSFLLEEEITATLMTGVAIFAIGLIKINFVFGNFMHLGWEHRPWRQVLTGWLAVVALILAGGLALLPWST